MQGTSPFVQSIFISQNSDDLADIIDDCKNRSKSLAAEESRESTTLSRIESLNDSIISSAVVTLAFLPIFDFNLDVELGNFIVIIISVWMILNSITIYMVMHEKRLNQNFGVAFTNTVTKGVFWTSQGVFFYGLNVLKPRLIGMNLNPIYILFFLWLYIGFWEIVKFIITSSANNNSKTKKP